MCSPSTDWAHGKTLKAAAKADFIDCFIFYTLEAARGKPVGLSSGRAGGH